MNEKGLTAISLKKINRSKVYQYIYRKKMTSKMQVVQELQMGLSTVSQNLNLLEQEGLIYPIKGKGNFVAETSLIQEKSKEDFRKDFSELIKKGIQTGITEEEMLSLVRKSCEEEQR